MSKSWLKQAKSTIREANWWLKSFDDADEAQFKEFESGEWITAYTKIEAQTHCLEIALSLLEKASYEIKKALCEVSDA